MDGNGRWAEENGLPRAEGHREGVKVVKMMVQACLEKKIAVLSLFAFGNDNWARPAEEVDFLMRLFLIVIEREIKDLCSRGVRVQFIGDRSQLSEALRDQMTAAEALTINNEALHLNIAMNYSGKWDILQACKALMTRALDEKIAPSELDEAGFECFLSTGGLPAPDLLIRTSGEQRLSNFFLWQLAFTEFYFTSMKWPEFTVEEFEQALTIYSRRERRYGLISKQLSEKSRHV
jgi:undecaprenyl diphosphate synthase